MKQYGEKKMNDAADSVNVSHSSDENNFQCKFSCIKMIPNIVFLLINCNTEFDKESDRSFEQFGELR